MKLVTVAEMRAIEAEANARGITYDMMMQRAGEGLAELVDATYRDADVNSILGLVGSGNNGGDVLVAMQALAVEGWQCKAYLPNPRQAKDELVKAFLEAGGELLYMADDPEFAQLEEILGEVDVLLDGILGTGVKLPLSEKIARMLAFIGDHPDLPPVVAVDCPSGVDCDSGAAAPETIPAELTICMQAVKTGLLAFPAFSKVGDIEVVDLDLPEDLKTWQSISSQVVDSELVNSLLPQRPLDGHKGTFGTVMLVAGSINYTGAALLAGKAAYRIGAGLVRLAVPAPLHTALAGHLPEATWVILPHEMGVISENAFEVVAKNLAKVDALLLGPGWGTEDTSAEFLNRLLAGKPAHGRGSIGFVNPASDTASAGEGGNALPPVVMDADGLKLLARIPDWHLQLPPQSVLTPHPGEMQALTGLEVAEINRDRLAVAQKYARQWGHVVILKGALSVIAAPDGRAAVVPVATSALAHAGTGDVLAGMVAGLRAQGLPAYEAGLCAAWIHAQAGLVAADWIGHPAAVLAGDVLESIADVLESLDW